LTDLGVIRWGSPNYVTKKLCHMEIGLTALQARMSQVRFPMGSLVFITGLKLPAVLWSWDRLNL